MGVKRYFQREFSKEKLFLEHDSVADFYLGCWQENRRILPLLCVRTIIFAGCIGTVLASMILTARAFNLRLWFIFLTHWGILFNLAASGLAFAVSLRALIRPIDGSLDIPWYVKAYWVLFNTAVPIAFFITVFYWSMLTELSEDYAMDPVLDVFIHGVNSILMLALLLTSRHPNRLLHFYWPIAIGLIYMVFTIIFHFAGGQSPFGTSWIYPMLDWDKPATTIAVVIGSAALIIVMHWIVVAISVGRDKLTRRFRDSNTMYLSN